MAAFRRRTRHYRSSPTRIPPIAIVGIVLVCTVIITVIVGNLLDNWLDDETYRDLTEGTPPLTPTEEIVKSNVRNVNAYPYLLGAKIDSMIGQTSASVLINTPSGEIQYASPVAERYAIPVKSNAPLYQSMGELRYFVPYVCGIYYPQSFTETSADLRYAAIGEECALLREFVNSGGSEILMCDVEITQETLPGVLAYLKTVKQSLGSAALGIAIPYETVIASDNWELLSQLSEICDFMAIDFTDVPIDESKTEDTGINTDAKEWLDTCDYFIKAYAMRPLFAQSQTTAISTAVTLMTPNFQVVGEK